MSISAYANRKYDYLGLQNVKAQGEASLGLELFTPTNSGQICVGVQKLAQRWALEFLTEDGSMPGLPSRGNEFMRLVRQGRIRSAPEVRGFFATSSLTIDRNLRNEEYAGMPDDERFESASLLGVSFLPGYLSLTVEIVSRAGSSREVILPISVLP
jgi:hypothetical protein